MRKRWYGYSVLPLLTAEIATNEPDSRARNGYFIIIATNEPNSRARNGYFTIIATNEPNSRARNG
jgi:uncharacterized protein YcaQ